MKKGKHHFEDLERLLEKNHWRVFERKSGKGYAQAEHWVVGRPDKTNLLTVSFSCDPGEEEWNRKNAYGCRVEEVPFAELYFSGGAT